MLDLEATRHLIENGAELFSTDESGKEDEDLVEVLARTCFLDRERSVLWFLPLAGIIHTGPHNEVAISPTTFRRGGVELSAPEVTGDGSILLRVDGDEVVGIRPVSARRKWKLIVWDRICAALTPGSRERVTSLLSDEPDIAFDTEVDLRMPRTTDPGN